MDWKDESTAEHAVESMACGDNAAGAVGIADVVAWARVGKLFLLFIILIKRMKIRKTMIVDWVGNLLPHIFDGECQI